MKRRYHLRRITKDSFSLVNAGSIPVATDSYCCSNNDDFEAYVGLKNLSDNISKLASLDS